MAELQRDAIRHNSIGKVLADASPRWPPQRREYHAITRDWITAELVRRVDPKQRTYGEFVEEEISQPLGISMHVGLPSELHHKVAPIEPTNPVWSVLQSLLPRCIRQEPWGMRWCLTHTAAEVRKILIDRSMMPFEDPFKGSQSAKANLADDWNAPMMRSAEIPSANGHSNAQGMAKLAALMAHGGEIEGVRLISEAGVREALAYPTSKYDPETEAVTCFTQGGFCVFNGEPLDNGGTVGWMGYGGSCLQWHPATDVGFGYAMNLLATDLTNSAGQWEGWSYFHQELLNAVLSCAKEVHGG